MEIFIIHNVKVGNRNEKKSSRFCTTLFWHFSTLFGDNGQIAKPIQLQSWPTMEILIIFDFIGVTGMTKNRQSNDFSYIHHCSGDPR
jgi:hypothetical protein